MGYVIRSNSDKELFWNNLYGWGDYEGRQIFPDDAPQTLNLPVGGEWVKEERACNKGYTICPKACFKEGCEETCEYAGECCTKYCLFPPAEVGEPIGIGASISDKEHNWVIDEILADEPSPRAKKFLDWVQRR